MSNLKLEFNPWDRVVGWFDPARAIKNAALRARMRMHGASPQTLSGSFNGGSSTRRRVRAWNPSAGSADADTLDDLPRLRERSRDAVRNEEAGGAAIRDAVANVIGRGLVPQSTPDIRALPGVSDEEVQDWQRETEMVWPFWASQTAADFERRETFRGLSRLAYRSYLENGDCVALIRQRPTMNSPLQTCIQLIEADRVSNPYGAADGSPAPKRPENAVLGGVERNKNGVPVAYWIQDQHPGEIASFRSSSFYTWKRIPSVGSIGQPLVLHICNPERIGQTRSPPFLAPILEALHSIAGYRAEAIDAARLANIFSVAITNEAGAGGIGTPGWSVDGETGGEPTVGDDEIALGGGSVFELRSGQRIDQIKPEHPIQSFEAFQNAVLKLCGARLGIPLEVLTKHFESSYTAARAAMQSAWRFYIDERSNFEERFNTPIRETVLIEAIGVGLVKPPRDFWTSKLRKWAWLRCTWHGPAPTLLDAVKEIMAGSMAVAEGFKTRAEVTAELTGGDWETKHAQRVREEIMRRAGGLAVDLASGKPPDAGGAGPGDEAEDDDEGADEDDETETEVEQEDAA